VESPRDSKRIFAVFLTIPNNSHIPELESFIRRTMTVDSSPLFTYAFVNYAAENSSELKSLSAPSFWLDLVRSLRVHLDHRSRDLISMDFFTLQYFLEERTEPWSSAELITH
jgi:hypothetical protein